MSGNKAQTKQKQRGAVAIMFRMLGLVKPLAGFMLLAIVSGVLGFLCAEFITIFGAYAMLNVMGFTTPLSLKGIFITVALLAVFRAVFRCSEQYLNHYIAFTLLALIRDKVFGALRRLCPAKLEGRDKGDLISVITSDIELLEVFYAHTISPICIAIIMSVLMTGFIAIQSIVLGLIAAAAYLCVGILVPTVIYQISGSTADEFRAQSGKFSAFVLESLRGLDEIIRFSAGERRIDVLKERADRLAGQQEKLSRNMGLNAAITNSAILIFDIAMLAAAVGLYNEGSIHFGTALVSVVAMMSSFGPVVALANLGSVLQNTIASGNRVLDILDESPVTDEITDGVDVTFNGAEVKNVTFAYHEEKILDNISLKLPKDRIVGMVGRSGSGKSTLLKLLMRFWDTDSGSVTVSGENVNQINTASLRQNESFVTQETQLFHDTIEYNVRLAKPDASHEEIVAACQKAAIHDFIMTLPNGYDTQVGELGDTLSGGERQRIGLARAFLHDAPLMLLDEPTSNLDSLNEAVILKSLSEQSGGKTVVLVSHRQSTMRICDEVFAVANGRMS